MTKYTQKQLKNLVRENVAIDITYANNETIEEIQKIERCLDEIGYSSGIYGCNGMLLKGRDTNKLYAITDRTTAIFILG